MVTGAYAIPTSPTCSEKLAMINFVGALVGEDDGEELGVSVVPPPGVLGGEVADDDGLDAVEGLV